MQMYCKKYKVPCLAVNVHVTISFVYLGIEFYLFVSHGGMNDRGSTCKFRNAQSAPQNLPVDPLSFIPP